MEHIFLLNPAAGDGRHIRRLVPLIRAAAEQTGIPYTLYETRAPGDANRLVERCAASGKSYRFYACGGDGTLNEAMQGAINQPNIEIACIPCGTGNDFVRSFGGKRRFEDIAAQMTAEQIVPVDIILSDSGHAAVNMINIGLDCNVADGAETIKRLPFVSGTPAYLLSLVKELVMPLGQIMAISSDAGGVRLGKFLLCAIGSGGYCGGGFHALPDADPTDGFIHLSMVRSLPRRKILPLLPRYYTGTYLEHKTSKEYITTHRCRRVSIRTSSPVRVCFDGEIVSLSSFSLQIFPHAVRFSLPEQKPSDK